MSQLRNRDRRKRADMLCPSMPDIRAAILAHMTKADVSTYALIKMLRGKRKDKKDVPASTVYSFLRDGHPINSADLGLIMDALRLDISHKGGK